MQALRSARYVAKWSGHPLMNMDMVTPVVLPIGDGLVAFCSLKWDTDADLSYLGEFTNRQTRDTIKHDETGRRHNEYKYFLPAITAAEHMAGPNGATHQEAMRYVRQDYDRARTYGEDWYMYAVVVTIKHDATDDLALARGSLWGIESDSDREHFAATALDLIREAKPDALAKLATIRTKLCTTA